MASVTENDNQQIWRFNLWQSHAQMQTHLELPAYWSRKRDRVLASTLTLEPFWASAVNIAISQITSRGWRLTTDSDAIDVDHYQMLLLDADMGGGWASFLSRHLQDYLLTDNGAFIEVVWDGDMPVGLVHLDSLQCTRTNDADFPVVYTDTSAQEHPLSARQVITFADMPSARNEHFGVGFCAASRAYSRIIKQHIVDRYEQEKIAGTHPQAIHIVTGISRNQLSDALQMTSEEMEARGVVYHRGVVAIPVLNDLPVTLNTLPISELPDGFNSQDELNRALLAYANALGLDPQDLQPLSGSQLGTGTQSEVLADKARGRGLSQWQQQFVRAINAHPLMPAGLTFEFTEEDYRDEKQRAENTGLWAGMYLNLFNAGLITYQEARQALHDNGVISVAQQEAHEATDNEKSLLDDGILELKRKLHRTVPSAIRLIREVERRVR